MRTHVLPIGAAIASMLLVSCGPSATAVAAAQDLQDLSAGLRVPADERLTVRTLGCDLSPGAAVLVDSALDVHGVGVLLEFVSTPIDRAFATSGFADLEARRAMSLQMVPASAQLGEAPLKADIYAQLMDGNGVLRDARVFVGRCGDGGGGIEVSGTVAASAAVHATSLDCEAEGGPEVTVEGTFTFAGAGTHFTFDDTRAGAFNRTFASMDVELVHPGLQLAIPAVTLKGKDPAATLWATFVDHEGKVLSRPARLGSCSGD